MVSKLAILDKLEDVACSDHNCIFLRRPRAGMGTNGGCRCVRTRPTRDIERLIRAQKDEIKKLACELAQYQLREKHASNR